jgi:hypothetical protein
MDSELVLPQSTTNTTLISEENASEGETEIISPVEAADGNTTINAGLVSALQEGSKQLPEMFIEADQDQRPKMDDSESPEDVPELDIPVFDLAVLQHQASSTGDETRDDAVRLRGELVNAVAKACQTWGFFQILNHGVDQSLIDRCEEQAHRMFELPLEVKERCHRPPGATFGYGANTWVNQKVMHWAESFHMQLHPTSNIQEMAAKLFTDEGSEEFRYLLYLIICIFFFKVRVMMMQFHQSC